MIHVLDIGGSTIKAAVAASPADVRPGRVVPTPTADFDAFVAAVAGALDPALPAGAPVSLTVPGVVDPKTGFPRCANLPCVDDRPLAADLSARLGRPVLVANDADAFALAEATVGAGRGHAIVFGAILGTGVGGGLVIDGRLVVGAGGLTGEWGHGPVVAQTAGDPPRRLPRLACGCGQSGCVDTVGGARGLERIHRALGHPPAGSEAILAAWAAGDPAAAETVACHVDLVSAPLALVVNVVGAGIVPVGGGLSRSPALIARLDAAVRGRILRRADRPLVVPGIVAVEPGLVGAAALWFAESRR